MHSLTHLLGTESQGSGPTRGPAPPPASHAATSICPLGLLGFNGVRQAMGSACLAQSACRSHLGYPQGGWLASRPAFLCLPPSRPCRQMTRIKASWSSCGNPQGPPGSPRLPRHPSLLGKEFSITKQSSLLRSHRSDA